MMPPRHAPTGLLATTVPGQVGYSTPRLRSATTPTTSTIIQRTRQHSLRKWVITLRASTVPTHTLTTRRRQGGSALVLPSPEGRPDQALRGPYLASTVQSMSWPCSSYDPDGAPRRRHLNAGITSRAKRVRFPFIIFRGVPRGHETMTCSSPG